MPQYIIKLTDTATKKDYYLMWSTVVDAPLTYGVSLDYFKKYYESEYGRQGMIELAERLERVENNGTSGYPPFDSLDGLISVNKAGDNGHKLTREQIIKKYCTDASNRI